MMNTKIPAAIKTPPPKAGPRAAGIDPRKGEDLMRGGQKTYQGDPDGMKPTTPPKIKSPSKT